MTPDERVRRLVEGGSIDAAEGARLLAAMHRPEPRSLLATLLDPFERFGGGIAATAGLLVAVASVAVSRLGVRFDGFFDMHVGRTTVPTLGVALVDQVVGWLVPSLVFWGYARALSRHVRLLDFVGMVGLARVAVLLSALVTGLALRDVTIDPTRLTAGLLLIAVSGLVFLALHITLLYQGFKNASGLAGPRLVSGFIGLCIAAEVLSKLALAAL